MEQNAQEARERKHALEHPLDDDRFDNDGHEAAPETNAERAEYEARLERNWKHAAWRTEMALRARAGRRDPSRPEGAF